MGDLVLGGLGSRRESAGVVLGLGHLRASGLHSGLHSANLRACRRDYGICLMEAGLCGTDTCARLLDTGLGLAHFGKSILCLSLILLILLLRDRTALNQCLRPPDLGLPVGLIRPGRRQ